ncbi:MAG: hypothetical protein NXI31_24730 [bacterium]|nr:hypothetical protein [bacterium]
MPDSPDRADSHPAIRAAIVTFRRRVATGAFVAGLLQGLLVVAIGFAVTLVGVRLCGGYLAPSWWWATLVLPVGLTGWWRASRARMPEAAAVAHLDRRLELNGLLLVGATAELEPTWLGRVERGLAGLPAALPRPRWRRLLPWPLAAAVLATLTAFLPAPPTVGPRTPLPTFQAEIGRIGGELRDLFERGHVPEPVERELRERLDELEQQVGNGEVPEWRDIDELDQRISREQMMQLAAAAEERAAASGAEGSSSARSPEALAAAAKMLADLGMLDNLPAQFAAALRAVQNADGSFDLDKLPFDPAELEALGRAFADAFGEFDPARLGLDQGQLADLRELAERFRRGNGSGNGGAGQGQGQGQGPGQGAGGRGGVNRGPGHTALAMTGDSQGGADQALPLPPGRGLPKDWIPVRSERITPIVAPTTSGGAGRAGAAGRGGATWQLDYAPRHRAVLRRFFGTGRGGKENK